MDRLHLEPPVLEVHKEWTDFPKVEQWEVELALSNKKKERLLDLTTSQSI